MSRLTADLRLIATAVEAQRDVLDQLAFCARAYLAAQRGEGALTPEQSREQLLSALSLAETILSQS